MKFYKLYIIVLISSLLITMGCSDTNEIPEVEDQEEEQEIIVEDINFEVDSRYTLPDNFIVGNASYDLAALPINLLITVVNKPIVDNRFASVIPDNRLFIDISEEPITLKDELVTENDCFLSSDAFTAKLIWEEELVFNVNNTVEIGETEDFDLLIQKKIVTALADPNDVNTTVISRKIRKGDVFEGNFFLNKNNERAFKNSWNEDNEVFTITYIEYDGSTAVRNLSYTLRKDKSGTATDFDNKIVYNWTPAGVIDKVALP